MQILSKFFKKETIFLFLISQILIHIIFGTTFSNTIFHEFEISQEIKNLKMPYNSYNVDTPLFQIFGSLLNIDDFRFFAVMVFLITNFAIYLICYHISFLKNNSIVFLFSGWLVTVSWFMGYVDVFTVLISVLIYKNIFVNLNFLRIIIFSILLTFNHYGIALFMLLIFYILSFNIHNKKIGINLLLGFIFGRLILQIYLNFINYSGRSRFRFVFNDNVLDQVFYLSSTNSMDLFISGFLGITVYLAIFTYFSNNEKKIKIVIALCVAFLGCSFALDTSRVFSMLTVPVIIFVLNYFENTVEINNKNFVNFLPFIAFIFMLLVDERHLFGSIFMESPNYDNSISIYSIVTEFFNNIMKNIWR